MKVRYQYYQNCNFTEVGESFAEQPVAVAVQQGSHLQKAISQHILELQKERYFENLSSESGYLVVRGCSYITLSTEGGGGKPKYNE